MLSFDSGLSSSIKNSQSVPFWVLKLYYNKEDTQALQSDGSTANLLAEALNSTETEVDVDYGAAFIAGDFIIIGSEVMEVSSVSSNELTVIRGSRGTTAATHSDNAVINFDNWIGVSDAHRVDGTDVYHGLVSSWGDYQQSLDYFDFTTSVGNTSVILINAENSIQGGRFSDLLSAKNFANRKWELFQNTNGLSTFDTAARMIGKGVISGNIDYDYKSIKFNLLDNSTSFHNQVPQNVVAVGTYANAPKGNINKPLPIFYGDCSVEANANSYGASGNYDKHFVKGKFPAIITDKWNVSDAQVYARVDSATVDNLTGENVYMYKDGYYIQCVHTNAEAISPNRVDFSGVDWRVFIPLAAHSTSGDVSNFGNTVDGDLTTHGSLNCISARNYTVDAYWRVPKTPNLGTIASVNFVILYKDFTPDSGSDSVTLFNVGVNEANYQNLTWGTGAGSQSVNVSSGYTTAEKEEWNLEDIIHLDLHAANTTHTLEIYQAGLEIKFTPSQTFEKQVTDYYEVLTGETQSNIEYRDRKGAEGVNIKRKVARTTTVATPDVADYVYISGKGREYGAWIDTVNSAVRTNGNGDAPDPNYDANAVIENPIYMIEDILRRELGLDSSTTGIDIDIETFDEAGNAQTDSTKGDIALLFADAIADIKFAFSQYKFINSKDLITKICRQCMSFVWFSGSGKFKIRTLLRPTDTWAADATVNFHEINLKNISRTPLNNVRNKIVINYAMDYARDKMMESTTDTDTTSNAAGVAGYNDTLTLELDADCILDKTTADNLRDAYLAHYKDRNPIISFDCVMPKYNDLEITDVIGFSNWDSKIKIYGTALGTSDFYMITDIAKNPHGCSIKCMKVN